MISCRQAVVRDIPYMVELLRQLFSIEKDFSFNPGKHRAGLMLLFQADSCKLFVAEKQGQVVGMCTLQTLNSTAEGAKVGLLEDLVVDEGRRNQGIGSLLLANVTEWAETAGLKRVQLLADKDNSPALKFYRKYNWNSTNLICIRKML